MDPGVRAVPGAMKAALAATVWLAGCADPAAQPPGTGPEPPPPGAAPPPPPDAGTQRGHAADATSVRVPPADSSPPAATIGVDGVRGGTLRRARFAATATGSDRESGVARIRVSVSQRLVCRRPGGRPFVRRLQRYFPPPQIERIKSSTGARLPARATRTRWMELRAGRCGPGADLETAHVEVWGEATNGLGLEAVTEHVLARFDPVRRP